MKNKNLFTKYYDTIMEDLDYNFWFDITNQYIKENNNVLDLGCGTGTLLLYLSAKKISLYGVDIDEEMIIKAQDKAKINHLDINLIHDDMLLYKNNNFFDLITCFFDTINYLNTEEKIISFFNINYQNLKNDGLLIFDFFTEKAYYESNNRVIKRSDDEIVYKWKMKIKKPNVLVHKIKIFNKKAEIYLEYYYDILSLIPACFEIINQFNSEERTVLVLKKISNQND